MPNYLQKLLFIISLPIAFLIGYFVTLQSPPHNSAITIEAAPRSSTVKIDGKTVDTGTNKIVAGKHTIEVSHDGFDSQSQTVSTSVGQTAYAGFVLSPNSPDTKNWYQDITEDQKLSETISSHVSDYNSHQATQANSLLQELPVSFGDGHGGLVTIDSGVPVQGSSQPAVYVTAQTPADRQSALDWMRSNGYNPATMDIVFKGVGLGFSPGVD